MCLPVFVLASLFVCVCLCVTSACFVLTDVPMYVCVRTCLILCSCVCLRTCAYFVCSCVCLFMAEFAVL